MIEAAAHALSALLEPVRFAILVGGVLLGLLLGVIPGLGGVVGLAILIPFTYNLDPYAAFALLLGMAAVTTISDLIPAVLFGVPGSVGAAATVMDGHELAKQGQAGRALGAGYMAALVGGIFGAVLLAVGLPLIRPIVLYMGSSELLAFCIFGLSMVAVLSGRAPLKGLAGVGLGLMLAMIGSGSQSGTPRWTFDSFYLWDHLPLIPLTLGLFAMPELAEMAVSRKSISRDANPDFSLKQQWVGASDALRNWWLVLRCSALGSILGTVPGLGAASIDWIAYGHAVRTEKNPERFGHGDIRGVIAPEASNNAKEGGHLIPTIAFGVPSGASMAVLLSAFLLHGLVPGPEMLTKHLDVTFSMIWSLTLAHVIGGFICLGFSGLFARLAVVPAGQLVPIVLCIMFVSAYQGSASWGDIYSAVIFGIIGWLMKIYGWPRPPLMLGFVLGALFERYLFISVEIYGFSWLMRPVVLVILAASAWVLFSPLKDSLRETARTFRTFRKDAFRFDGRIAFNLAVITVVVYALWLSRDWPWDTKLVPQTACYLALVFAGLNLLTESFVPRSAAAHVGHSGASGHMDAVVSLEGAHTVSRAWRHFGWIGAFLIVSATIGLLPGIALLILTQSRFEFDQSWLFSVLATTIVTVALWLVFDRIFSVSWPPSFLGDAYPELRSMLRII
ncbi:tripartite tricarboxylate transporter permease [Microbacteriaceae bacterium K1510]|nr:tripartite tricarboxylate transporter permease [Microbacteriaceae bacterium K1510]